MISGESVNAEERQHSTWKSCLANNVLVSRNDEKLFWEATSVLYIYMIYLQNPVQRSKWVNMCVQLK